MGIHPSSLSQIICKDLHLKCFKRCRAQELTDGNCDARMKHANLLLQKFPQYTTDLVFFMGEKVKVFSVTSPDNRQNEVSGRMWELLKKKLSVFFGADTARSATAWPPDNYACVPQLLNSLLTPRFVERFSGNSSVILFAVYSFKYKVTSAVTNFQCHKLITKVNK